MLKGAKLVGYASRLAQKTLSRLYVCSGLLKLGKSKVNIEEFKQSLYKAHFAVQRPTEYGQIE